MNRFFLKMLAVGLLGVSASGEAWARAADVPAASAKGDYYSILVAERRVASLPGGQLYWKIERFPTLQAAESVPASDYALTASIADKNWLFTLGAKGAAAHGGTAIAEIGPVTAPRATSFLLRVSHAGGPPGSRTAAYALAGSEATYVLSGQSSRPTMVGGTPRGMIVGGAGDALNGVAPDVATQTMSTGTADLEQIMLSVLDADRPGERALAFAAKPAQPAKARRSGQRSRGGRRIRPPILVDVPEPPEVSPPPVEPRQPPPPEPVRLIPAPSRER